MTKGVQITRHKHVGVFEVEVGVGKEEHGQDELEMMVLKAMARDGWEVQGVRFRYFISPTTADKMGVIDIPHVVSVLLTVVVLSLFYFVSGM